MLIRLDYEFVDETPQHFPQDKVSKLPRQVYHSPTKQYVTIWNWYLEVESLDQIRLYLESPEVIWYNTLRYERDEGYYLTYSDYV